MGMLAIAGITMLCVSCSVLSTITVLNKVIPKSKSPKLDKDMEELLNKHGYVDLEEWRNKNDK